MKFKWIIPIVCLILPQTVMAAPLTWQQQQAKTNLLQSKQNLTFSKVFVAKAALKKMKRWDNRIKLTYFKAAARTSLQTKKSKFTAAREKLVAELKKYKAMQSRMKRFLKYRINFWKKLKKIKPTKRTSLDRFSNGIPASVSNIFTLLLMVDQLSLYVGQVDPNGDGNSLMNQGTALGQAAATYIQAGDSYWPSAQTNAETQYQSEVNQANSDYNQSRTAVKESTSSVSSVNNLLQTFQ